MVRSVMEFKTIICDLDNLRVDKMKLNKYFHRSEFACKCGCGFDTVDTELLKVLTRLRVRFNKPVKITSACRCEP